MACGCPQTRRPFLWDIRCRMPRRDPPGQLARKPAWQGCPCRVVPIRSCSRWGLPCRRRCRHTRWALTPPFHPGRGKPRWFLFCGTFPRVARLPASPAGSYPASLFHGARTFLQRGLSADASAAARPTGMAHIGTGKGGSQGRTPLPDKSGLPSNTDDDILYRSAQRFWHGRCIAIANDQVRPPPIGSKPFCKIRPHQSNFDRLVDESVTNTH